MHSIFRSNFIRRSVSPNRFQCHLRLQFCAVSLALSCHRFPPCCASLDTAILSYLPVQETGTIIISNLWSKKMSSATTIETISKTKQLAAKVIYEAFTILKKAGGQLPGREVVHQIEKNLTFTPWETERYEKSGYIRWQSILHFYTIDAIKAGFLRKQKGIWILTTEGEEAMKLGQIGLLDKANEAYKVWKGKNKDTEIEVEQKDTPVSVQS